MFGKIRLTESAFAATFCLIVAISSVVYSLLRLYVMLRI